MKQCQKINLQELQRNRNADTNFDNLKRTSTVVCADHFHIKKLYM